MKNNISLLLFNINNLKDKSIFNKAYDLSSIERKEKVNRLKNESDKLRSIGVELLYLYAKEHMIFNDYNLSHSGEFALLGISDCKIGVDIERIRPINLKISKRFFTENENHYIDDDYNRFFTIWTLKESYLKCIKKGLRLSLSSFEINIENKMTSNGYYLESIDENGYKIGVCTNEEPTDVILYNIEKKDIIKWLEKC